MKDMISYKHKELKNIRNLEPDSLQTSTVQLWDAMLSSYHKGNFGWTCSPGEQVLREIRKFSALEKYRRHLNKSQRQTEGEKNGIEK